MFKQRWFRTGMQLTTALNHLKAVMLGSFAAGLVVGAMIRDPQDVAYLVKKIADVLLR